LFSDRNNSHIRGHVEGRVLAFQALLNGVHLRCRLGQSHPGLQAPNNVERMTRSLTNCFRIECQRNPQVRRRRGEGAQHSPASARELKTFGHNADDFVIIAVERETLADRIWICDEVILSEFVDVQHYLIATWLLFFRSKRASTNWADT